MSLTLCLPWPDGNAVLPFDLKEHCHSLKPWRSQEGKLSSTSIVSPDEAKVTLGKVGRMRRCTHQGDLIALSQEFILRSPPS